MRMLAAFPESIVILSALHEWQWWLLFPLTHLRIKVLALACCMNQSLSVTLISGKPAPAHSERFYFLENK